MIKFKILLKFKLIFLDWFHYSKRKRGLFKFERVNAAWPQCLENNFQDIYLADAIWIQSTQTEFKSHFCIMFYFVYDIELVAYGRQ